MHKYAICYAYCSVGQATANSQIVWLTNSPLAWVIDLEDAQFWDERVIAEAEMEKASQSIAGIGKGFLNVVAINWYDGRM
ncbi:MAG: hypothetical protein ABI262_24905 [Microcoleus sp.]|mgnify:CR=1 FL=1|jgi:hypothetical protein